jgi:hypothetical protein
MDYLKFCYVDVKLVAVGEEALWSAVPELPLLCRIVSSGACVWDFTTTI